MTTEIAVPAIRAEPREVPFGAKDFLIHIEAEGLQLSGTPFMVAGAGGNGEGPAGAAITGTTINSETSADLLVTGPTLATMAWSIIEDVSTVNASLSSMEMFVETALVESVAEATPVPPISELPPVETTEPVPAV